MARLRPGEDGLRRKLSGLHSRTDREQAPRPGWAWQFDTFAASMEIFLLLTALAKALIFVLAAILPIINPLAMAPTFL